MQHEQAPRHKRKGSALELSEGLDLTCKVARDSEEEEEEEQQQQQEETEEQQPEQPLTERNGMHMLTLSTSQEELLKKIDDITGWRQGCRRAALLSAAVAASVTCCVPLQDRESLLLWSLLPAHASSCRPLITRAPPRPAAGPCSPLAAAAGERVLDQMQANFLERMSRVKAEVSKLVGQAHVTLQTQSSTTMELQRRALLAGQLIDKLNFKTQDPQQARPDTLFSTEDEAEQAEPTPAQE